MLTIKHDIEIDSSDSKVVKYLSLEPEFLKVRFSGEPAGCFNIGKQNSSLQEISYKYILNAICYNCEQSRLPCIKIDTLYRKKHGTKLKLISISGTSSNTQQSLKDVQEWCNLLNDRAYQGVKRNRRLKVLVNPFGGPGKAPQIWSNAEQVFNKAGCSLDVEFTQYKAQAEEIAENLDMFAYDGIVCVSGDGIIHEVLNGFARRPDACQALRKVAIGVIPGGSGNALAVSLIGPEKIADIFESVIGIIKGRRSKMALAWMTQIGQPDRVTFLSQSYGLVADADLGSEHLRWLGDLRFVIEFIKGVFENRRYVYDLKARVVSEDKEAMANGKITKNLTRVYNQKDDDDDDDNKQENGEIGDELSTTTAGSDIKNNIMDMAIPSPRFGRIQDQVDPTWTDMGDKTWSFYAGTQPYMSKDLLQFPFTKQDALIDLTYMDNNLGQMELLKEIDKSTRGEHVWNPKCIYTKVEAYRLIPKGRAGKKQNKKTFISIDGETVPNTPFQVEGLGDLARVFKL